MRSIFFAALALGISSLAAHAQQIDWTPRFITVQAEGAVLHRAYFSAGTKRFAMSIDSETTVEAAGGGARMSFKGVPSATFAIRAADPKLELPPPDPKKLDDYRAAALAFAPEGAENFTTVEEVFDPLNINDWRSYRLNFTYSFFGRRHHRSVTFLTFPDGQQAVLDTAALEPEFREAMARSEYLIRTWHELPPVSAAPPQS